MKNTLEPESFHILFTITHAVQRLQDLVKHTNANLDELIDYNETIFYIINLFLWEKKETLASLLCQGCLCKKHSWQYFEIVFLIWCYKVVREIACFSTK